MFWYLDKVPEQQVFDPPTGNGAFVPAETWREVCRCPRAISLEAGVTIMYLFTFSLVLFYIV